MNQNGSITVKGRDKEIIKTETGGVFQLSVENVLLSYPGIKEACAFGLPSNANSETDNKANNEVVCAWVRVVSTDENLTEQKLIEFCSQHLNENQVPKYILFKDAIPQTFCGKNDRPEMRKKTIKELNEKI